MVFSTARWVIEAMRQGMDSKLSGVSSWLLAGIAAFVVAVPSISWSAALSNEELRTAYASTSTTPNRQRTVQVGPRDTLWSIARATRPNDGITIKQAMLAIRDANPSAFPSGNINEMEMGVRLTIPSIQAMKRLSAMQAEQEVRRQNQAWVASRAPAAPATKTVKTPAAKPKASVTAAVNDKPEIKQPVKPLAKEQPLDLPDSTASMPVPQRDLTLVTPKANQAQVERINQLKNDLATSEESLQVAEREKDELAERISDMQQQVSTLQQLIQLKDQQLADMEKQLAQEQAKPGTTRSLVVKEPEPEDLASQIKRQPELYGALLGSVLLLLILFFALLSARKKLKAERQQNSQTDKSKPFSTAFAEDQVTSADFDLDLNAHPLEGLDELEGLEELDSLDLDDDYDLAKDDNLSLDSLEDELASFDEPTPAKTAASPAPVKDPLEEAETFIAYGRLEQAAGFLQTALEKTPGREDLRLKLLEVLVELNDEETFNQHQEQLSAHSASATGLARAEELAKLFAPANTTSASATDFSDNDLNELDLGDLDLDMDLDDLDSIFPGEELVINKEPEISFEASGQIDDSIDDLADLDSLEADLDSLIATKEPVAPTKDEPLDEDDFDLEELNESDLENLELELDLEKPLDAKELADEVDSSTDFEPVDYKSDADDFMQALDSLSLDGLDDEADDSTSEASSKNSQQAPGVDEELAALNENLAELEAFTDDKPLASDDLGSDDLEELSDFGDLSELGDQDFDLDDLETNMSTQLDLATAYIEMGDKEGAREILEKVVKEGDADFKATAQQMLETLAN